MYMYRDSKDILRPNLSKNFELSESNFFFTSYFRLYVFFNLYNNAYLYNFKSEMINFMNNIMIEYIKFKII